MVIQPDTGGAFEHLARLSSGVAARGHEVFVTGPLDHCRAELDVETIHVEMGRGIAPTADLKATEGLARLVRRLRPGVVHAHSSKAGALARLARTASPRTPVIHTPHGYAFAGYLESALERTGYRALEHSLAPLASRVICVCEAERRLARSLGLGKRARLVYNGVEPPQPASPHPALGRIGPGGQVVCAVSGLRAGKGVETLIDAMPAVLAEHPQVTLVVAGDGPRHRSLAERIERLGIGAAVHLLAHVAQPAEVLVGADVFVAPSWAESFPYAVLEAMSRGLPIVATDVGGTGEAIEDGVTGRIVPARDPHALAAAISTLLDDERSAIGMGTAARRRATSRFTLEGMIDGALEVYEEVIA